MLGALAAWSVAAAQGAVNGAMNAAGADAMRAHTVSVTIANTTSHQTFAAPVLLSHSRAYAPFALGVPAYPELVPLAEDGMTGDLVTVARVDTAILDYAVASGPLAPGRSVTLHVRVDDAHPLLSAFGMLVTTNDTVFYYGADLAMAGGSGAASDTMGASGAASDTMGASSASDAMGSDAMGSDAMGSDAMGSDAMGSDAMGSGTMGPADAMSTPIDLYDGTVRALDAGSEANTESCRDIPGPPCGSAGVRHPAMAEGVVTVSKGLTGSGDVDAAVYGWADPVATVRLSAP